MKSNMLRFSLILLLVFMISCQQNKIITKPSNVETKNSIQYAKGLSIYKYKGYSMVKITNPWPKSNKEFTYILKEKNGIVPDSLKKHTLISIPLKTIVVTSTTHIPSLEMLGVENTLVGFPNTDYISSKKMRERIEAGKVRDLGSNESINTEVLIDIQPDLLIGYGIDNNNQALNNIQKSGIKVMLNGDWNEQSPLGKAEWIKFFGVLYGKESKANSFFLNIVKEYNAILKLAKLSKTKPTVLMGAIFENQWYLPEGNSWGSLFINDAGGNYLWNKTKGTGSLSLSFETVLDCAKNADFWIGPAQFTSLKEMTDNNSHYKQFEAFKSKKVYSFSIKKGEKGGIVYYELAPNRPDLVLKDLLKILHPEMLPNYKLYFFEQLK